MPETVADVSELFTKWILLFEITPEERAELYHALHADVTTGFDIISQLGWELCSSPTRSALTAMQDAIMEQLVYNVWGGYMLFLLEHNLDPVAQKLKTTAYPTPLLETWQAAYVKDQGEQYRLEIPWITSLLLNTATRIRTDRLAATVGSLGQQPYQDILRIRDALGWAGIQGYCLAMMEDQQKNTHGTA